MRFKVQEANSVLYKKQKEAEAELYENRKAAELFYVYEDQATANMMYRVARASEFLVITGIGIDELKITKKALIWPLQKCRVIDVTPVNYTFEVNAMSAEKLPFLLPAVFTIGQCVDDRERLIKYA